MIDWTNCPDVESVPDRCGGQWVVRDTRVIVESCILDNAEDCSAEEVAEMFTVPVDVARRILRFAYQSEGAVDVVRQTFVCFDPVHGFQSVGDVAAREEGVSLTIKNSRFNKLKNRRLHDKMISFSHTCQLLQACQDNSTV
jgi:uncharacterized protein (DUF433 family)